MWLRFSKLSPSQSVAALKHMEKHVSFGTSDFKKENLEFLIVDGHVKGSRSYRTPKQDNDLKRLLSQDTGVKTSLEGWTSGPRKWHLDV